MKILEKTCSRIDLHRLEENENEIDLSLNIELVNNLSLDELSNNLRNFSNDKNQLRFTLLDTVNGKIL